jgi:hypothetical protein
MGKFTHYANKNTQAYSLKSDEANVNTFLILLIALLIVSCAPSQDKSNVVFSSSRLSFSPLGDSIEEKLQHIFIYQVVAYKNSHSFWKVEAARKQVEMIKRDLKFILSGSFSEMNSNRRAMIGSLIIHFSQRSSIHGYIVSKIFSQDEFKKLGIKITFSPIQPDHIKAAIKEVSPLHIFKVYEKNIEHLSYISELKVRSSEKS